MAETHAPHNPGTSWHNLRYLTPAAATHGVTTSSPTTFDLTVCTQFTKPQVLCIAHFAFTLELACVRQMKCVRLKQDVWGSSRYDNQYNKPCRFPSLLLQLSLSLFSYKPSLFLGYSHHRSIILAFTGNPTIPYGNPAVTLAYNVNTNC